ncbi:hypothetical protein [Phaeodactylibacter luteus]|uniref:Lysine transporter LysE n=1 Tax=Phaeodactylibacter luteus TaxID=1564516 RepID=A0A5C6RIT5_9BACT|nr:hypothetical protein [Phaeodactylibacter luteus]TXB62033.1 hypothetical protein FRY97_16250 [Phaeodactylibacter luteus]
MEYIMHSFWGFLSMALGVALPGLVNMTTVRECIKRGYAAANRFNIGAAGAVFIHGYIAIAFAGLFTRHPSWLSYLRQAAVALFAALSFVFLVQALRRQVAKGSRRKGRPVLKGFVVSFFNVLNVPGIFAFGTLLRARDLITFSSPYRLFFILGAASGAYAVLTVYARFARRVEQAGATFYKQLNFALSALFLALALVQLVQLWYGA